MTNLNLKKIYHGSMRRLEVLQPFPCSLLNQLPVVFGSPHKAVALAFAGGLWTDEEIDLGMVNGKLVFKELKEGAFNAWRCGGWLYTFPQNVEVKFDPRIGNFEVYSTGAITPSCQIYVTDLFEAMQQEENLTLEFFRA